MSADLPADPPLPELNESVLDDATVARLFADLAACTRVLDVGVKVAATAMAPQGRVTLGEAEALLAQGAVRGVQVRYLYDGAEWCDTLIRTPAGTRIVRMRA